MSAPTSSFLADEDGAHDTSSKMSEMIRRAAEDARFENPVHAERPICFFFIIATPGNVKRSTGAKNAPRSARVLSSRAHLLTAYVLYHGRMKKATLKTH